MASFPQYEQGYIDDWASLSIRPERAADIQRQARLLLQGKAIYATIEAKTGVPWWFIGLCHYRESNFNFNTYLGNGQALNRVTTIVPKGRGPFLGPDAFVDGAVDALRIEGFIGATDWSIARVLYRLEGFNGYGYHGYGVNSPYLYGGSTLYGPPEARGGKYVSDGVFNPNVVDTQLGTAVILKELMQLDSTITIQPAPAQQSIQPEDEAASSALWLQQSLNRLGGTTLLDEDSWNGRPTMAAVSAFQRGNGLPDTGIADAATIAAIARQLNTAPSIATITALSQRVTQLELGAVAAGPQVVPIRAGQTVKPPPGNNAYLSPLGQVNGALGVTVGNLLDGKKAAIGIIGATLTSILSQVPSDTGVGEILSHFPKLGPYAMPIFLALSAWGILGKFEKWAQGTPPQQ